MAREKRYTVTASFYIYAENDEKAKAQALNWAKNEVKHKDNQCGIDSLDETPFGSFESRNINLNK